MTDDELIAFYKSATSLNDAQTIQALVALKTHELAGVRKTAKKALANNAPKSLDAFMTAFKGKLSEDPAKFCKKFESIDTAALAVDPIVLAQALHAQGAAALFYLMGVGGEVAKNAMQASLQSMKETFHADNPYEVPRPIDGLLVLDGYKNKTIPESIRDVKGLKALSLFGCGLKEVPPVLFELEELEFLNLMDNRIKSLPSGMAKMKRLRILKLRKAPLSQGIATMPALEEVQLYHDTQLADLSPLLLSSLRRLHVQDAPKLKFKENDFENASALKSMQIHQPIESLPSSFFALALEELSLRFSTEIPEALTTMTSLKKLDLSFSEVDKLPAGVENLTNLEVLDISFTAIADIKPLFALNLESLDTGYCHQLSKAQANELKQKRPQITILR